MQDWKQSDCAVSLYYNQWNETAVESNTDETHHYGVLYVFPNILDFLFLFSTGETTDVWGRSYKHINHSRPQKRLIIKVVMSKTGVTARLECFWYNYTYSTWVKPENVYRCGSSNCTMYDRVQENAKLKLYNLLHSLSVLIFNVKNAQQCHLVSQICSSFSFKHKVLQLQGC